MSQHRRRPSLATIAAVGLGLAGPGRDGPAAAQEGAGRLPRPGPGAEAQRLPDLPPRARAGQPTTSDDRPHNAFGKRLKAVRAELKKAGKPSDIPARVQAMAGEDSDGDGVPNLLELVTGHFPGEAGDRPAAPELARGRAIVAALERSSRRLSVEPVRAGVATVGTGRPATGAIRNPIDAFIAAEHAAHAACLPGPRRAGRSSCGG